MNETDPKILGEFVEEKMDLFVTKLNGLEMEGTGAELIDLLSSSGVDYRDSYADIESGMESGYDMKKFLKSLNVDYDSAKFAIKVVVVYGCIWLFGVVLNLIAANTLTQLLVTALTVFHVLVLPLISYMTIIYLLKARTRQ